MDNKLPITRLSKFFSQDDFDINIQMGQEYLHGDLNMKLGMLTDFHKGMSLRATEKGSNYVSFGLDMKQLERYIDTLEKMAAWALKNNYDTISYC